MRKFIWTFRSSRPRCRCRNPRCCTCEKYKSQRDLFICTHTWHGKLRLRDAKKRNKKASGSGEAHACRVAIERASCTCGVPGPKERVNFYPHFGKHGTKRYGPDRSKTCLRVKAQEKGWVFRGVGFVSNISTYRDTLCLHENDRSSSSM